MAGPFPPPSLQEHSQRAACSGVGLLALTLLTKKGRCCLCCPGVPCRLCASALSCGCCSWPFLRPAQPPEPVRMAAFAALVLRPGEVQNVSKCTYVSSAAAAQETWIWVKETTDLAGVDHTGAAGLSLAGSVLVLLLACVSSVVKKRNRGRREATAQPSARLTLKKEKEAVYGKRAAVGRRTTTASGLMALALEIGTLSSHFGRVAMRCISIDASSPLRLCVPFALS